MHRSGVRFTVAITAALLLPTGAAGQGFGVYTQGACTMGRAGASVASPCRDGSAIYFNPAGIAVTPKRFSVGGTAIVPQSTFQNDNTGLEGNFEDALYPVPNLYITGPVRDNVAIGLGVFVPFGLTTEWDRETFEGRFLGYRSSLRAVYVQPTVAVRFGKLSVGAGVDITNLSVKLQRRVDLSSVAAAPGVTFGNLGVPFGTDFADATLEGDAWGLGYHVGVLAELHPRVSLGIRYMSRQKLEADDGEARFSQVPTGLVLAAGNPLGAPAGTPVDAILAPQFALGGQLSTQSASATVRLPDQAAVGIAVKPATKLTLLVDAQYTWWNAFTEIPLSFELAPDQVLEENFNAVWTFRFGGEYQLSDKRNSVLRAGWYTHDAAAPDESVTPNLPEAARTAFTLGFGTRLGQWISLDAAYQYVDEADRRGRTIDGPNNGLYRDQHAHLLGVSFVFDF